MFNYAVRAGPFTRTDELPVGQNGNGLKTDKNSNRTEIKRERNGITRPVVRMGDGNFFFTPTICDNFEQFNDRHYKLTSKLIKQGFWYTRLCYLKKRFSITHSEIFCKYIYYVSKHIQEGICLPVTVRVDLAKNITTRSR